MFENFVEKKKSGDWTIISINRTMTSWKEQEDLADKRGNKKGESNDSPGIPNGVGWGESDINSLPSPFKVSCKTMTFIILPSSLFIPLCNDKSRQAQDKMQSSLKRRGTNGQLCTCKLIHRSIYAPAYQVWSQKGLIQHLR